MPRPTSTPQIAGEARLVREASPFPVAASPVAGFASGETLTEGALARAPQAASPAAGAPSVEVLRHAIGSALVEAGHVSAAQVLGTSSWILDGSSLRIEVPGMGKKMLSLTINAAAEKIIRQELQQLGASPRFMVVPGDGAAPAASGAPMAAPLAGSIQEAALAHPLVQRAKEIFKAEVRSVVDLHLK